MRVEFESTYGDILIFSVLHNFLSARVQRWAAVMTVLTAALMFAFHPDLVPVLQAAALAYAVFWVGNILFILISLRMIDPEKSLGFKIIELQEAALFEESAYNQSYHYWPNIVKIVRWPRSITVYIGEHVAHVIPTRAFSTKLARKDFWRALHDYWKRGAEHIQRPDLIHVLPIQASVGRPEAVSDVMPRYLYGACLLYIAARGAMAVLAPLYETGAARVTSPALMLFFNMIPVLFIRRVRWSWVGMGAVAFNEILVNAIFFPAPGYYRGYLAWSQLFTALAMAASCVILWSIVWRKQTKSWFQRR